MDDLQPLIEVLSRPTIYDTSAVLSFQQGIISSALNYNTLDEEYVIQRTIQDYQEKKKRETAAWRIGGAIVGGLFGLDGFQVQDIFAAVAVSAAASGIAKAIQDLDDNDLRKLGLEWVNQPNSYIYHKKRHRGDAARRLLLIAPNPNTNEPRTAFAVQFPDGYVSFLRIIDGLNQPIFTVSDGGFYTDWVEEKHNLGSLPVDSGMSLPVEFWCNNSGTSAVVIPYRTPHHSLY